MDKKYEDSIHRTGRIGIIIGIILMLGIPAVISSVYDVWPESAAQVITAGSGLLAVFIPTCIAEVFSYTPILGSSAYITFLTGNVMNLKVPVVVNAQIMSDTASGTEEGDAVATIGVAVSSIVTTLIIAGGVLLLVPLRPILTSPTVQTATTYLLPALFGGIFLSFVNNDCGDYVAKGKPLTMPHIITPDWQKGTPQFMQRAPCNFCSSSLNGMWNSFQFLMRSFGGSAFPVLRS